MNIADPRLVDRLVASHLADEEDPVVFRRITAKIIADLAAIENVVRARGRIDAEMVAERKRHAEATKAITDRLSIIQEQCYHYLSEYHPDPAGGSDSHHTCLICGKQY